MAKDTFERVESDVGTTVARNISWILATLMPLLYSIVYPPLRQTTPRVFKISPTGVCRMAEVCRKGTLGSMLARRAASLLLIRLLFVLKPPL